MQTRISHGNEKPQAGGNTGKQFKIGWSRTTGSSECRTLGFTNHWSASFRAFQRAKVTEKVERCRKDKETAKGKYGEALQELNRANPKYMDDMNEVEIQLLTIQGWSSSSDVNAFVFSFPLCSAGLRPVSNIREGSPGEIPWILRRHGKMSRPEPSIAVSRLSTLRMSISRKTVFAFSLLFCCFELFL